MSSNIIGNIYIITIEITINRDAKHYNIYIYYTSIYYTPYYRNESNYLIWM